MPTQFKYPIIILTLIFLTYTPILFNHFIGDDHILIEKNTFYASWKNMPRLFEKGYIANLKVINYSSETLSDFGPGSVSYRPVSNLTYFFDYSLFQAKPYGSHLINILIHSANAILVYWLINRLFSSSLLGLFAGLLFSLHPVQSEAVAVMSYRADIVAAFFVLNSFYFWVKFQQGGYLRRKYYWGSLSMFFLGLLSKESAVMLPFVIVCFDQLLAVPRLSVRFRCKCYLGFVSILIFYLYLYLIVFPNSSFSFHWLGGTFINHCLIMGYIWHTYLINILLPWTVKLIPGLYCPVPPLLSSLVTAKIGLALIIFLVSIWLLWRNYKQAVFFLLWYSLFYLPVSNLVPIANPMAYRFMYLPSIGLLVTLAWILHKGISSHFLKQYSRHLSAILHAAVITICVTCTLFLNADWKSDFDVGYAWVKAYPSAYRGYAMLGKVYFYAGSFKEAKVYLERSIQLGDQIPSDVFNLGQCYRLLGELREAEALLKQIILHNPDYADPYFELAGVYYFQNNIILEQKMLEKGLALNPKKSVKYMPLR
jgi:protein O-mannosyl-transferase